MLKKRKSHTKSVFFEEKDQRKIRTIHISIQTKLHACVILILYVDYYWLACFPLITVRSDVYRVARLSESTIESFFHIFLSYLHLLLLLNMRTHTLSHPKSLHFTQATLLCSINHEKKNSKKKIPF